MRFLIVSDTHGRLERVLDVFNKIGEIDGIIHCGDYIEDALELQAITSAKVIACYGNCDSGRLGKEYEILDTEAGSFFITHGDRYGVYWELDKLGYKAMEENCIGAIFGHTHVATFVKEDDIIFINPGSLSKPRDNSGGTYFVLETSEEGINGRIGYYQEEF